MSSLFLTIPRAVVLFVVFVGVGVFASFSEPSKADVETQTTPENCPTCSTEIERTIYAPTIGMPESGPGNIVLNCRSADPIETTPTFYTDSGEAIVGDPIVLQPAEMRFVTIESLIPEAHRGQHTWGGMSFTYTGYLMEMWAQITLPGVGQRGSTDVTFSVINNLGSDTQEAVWWQPKPGKRVIVLGNSSNVAVHTSVQFSNGNIEEIDIAPFATHYLRKNFDSGQDGGQSVKLTTKGPAGSLKASGYVISNNGSNSHRFASSIRFYDTQGVVQPKLFANNFRLKNAVSHLLLKNTSSSPITTRPKFRPTDGNGDPVTLHQITLDPDEIREVNLQPLMNAAANRDDLDSVSVQINNDGSAGSLIGSLYSTNQNTGVNHDIPLRDSGRMRNSTGGYPWRLDGDFRSVVTLTNTGEAPVEFVATIFYEGGRYSLMPRTVGPGKTAKYNLKKIRDEQIPDAFGNSLPIGATTGQFKWGIIRPTASDRLIGRSEVVSESGRVSSSYSCGLSCPPSGPYYNPDTPYQPSLVAGELVGSDLVEVWQYGSGVGGTSTYPGYYPGLYISDSGIAEASMPEAGLIETTGISAGYSTWFSGTYTQWHWFDAGYDCFYNEQGMEDSGAVEVVGIQKVQYKGPNNSTFTDASATLYVLKDTEINFKPIPNPETATFPSGQPTWSGTSGATGTGATKSVSFGTVSSGMSDYKTVVATAGNTSITTNVIVYELTGAFVPEDDFSGRSTTRYGLRELVNLGFQASPSVPVSSLGGLRWSVGSSQGTVTNESGNNGIGQYEAPFAATTANLEISVVDGPSKDLKRSYSKTIVAPSGGSVMRDTTRALIHCNGYSSAGFYGKIYLSPTDVSFTRIYFTEGGGEINASGFYQSEDGLEHVAWGFAVIPSDCSSATGCLAHGFDTVYTGRWNAPFSSGSLSVPIDWQYSQTELVGSAVTFATATHQAAVVSSGTATISKQGSGNFSRAVNDPSSGDGCTIGN